MKSYPAIIAIDHAMRAKNIQVQVAKEAYKPQFGMNLGYGYRDDNPIGDSRADLLSIAS